MIITTAAELEDRISATQGALGNAKKDVLYGVLNIGSNVAAIGAMATAVDVLVPKLMPVIHGIPNAMQVAQVMGGVAVAGVALAIGATCGVLAYGHAKSVKQDFSYALTLRRQMQSQKDALDDANNPVGPAPTRRM